MRQERQGRHNPALGEVAAKIREGAEIARRKGYVDVAGDLTAQARALEERYGLIPPSERARVLREIGERARASQFGEVDRAQFRERMRALEETKQMLLRLADRFR